MFHLMMGLDMVSDLNWDAQLEGPFQSSARVVHAKQSEENPENYDYNVVDHDEPRHCGALDFEVENCRPKIKIVIRINKATKNIEDEQISGDKTYHMKESIHPVKLPMNPMRIVK